jgi:hypothetical protein
MVNGVQKISSSTVIPRQIESYCLFEGKVITDILTADEFDMVVDLERPIENRQGKVYAAYVLANQSQIIQSIVLFILPLNLHGYCKEGWRLPLERLSNTASRGPNLGGGRIRLACRSQCSISMHQDNLWDPSANHFSAIKGSLESYLTEFDDSIVSLDLSKVSEDQQPENSEGVDQLCREFRNESAAYRNELQQLQQETEQLRLLNERLANSARTDVPRAGGVKPLEHKVDLQVLRRQNEMLSMKNRELQLSNERLRLELASEDDASSDSQNINDKEINDQYDINTIETITAKMSAQDMISVVHHHGIGHINIKPNQLVDYLDDPIAYATNHIDISKLQYNRWLKHEDSSSCNVCDESVVVIADPAIFDFEVDVYCNRHKP